MKTAAFYTLGCKVNQYDTEAVSGIFRDFGYSFVPFDQKADVYVINTCTVTALSERKSRQMIRRANKINPDAFVVVTGCYAQGCPDEVSGIEGVDMVIGMNERYRIRDFLEALEENKETGKGEITCSVSDIMQVKDFEEIKLKSFSGKTRAFLKIQDGCDSFCSYCIIPYVRGRSRSRKREDVLEEARRLSEEGFKEIVVTGIHTASYGREFGDSLTGILKEIHVINGIERIRLGSIEPGTVNDEFVRTVKGLEKMCPQYHVSLQSGCDETLRRMNRKYTANEYARSIEALRENIQDVAVTTDVMVGFPGETDEEFDESYSFLKRIGFSRMHVFKYSRRKGTRAFLFPGQVSAQIKEHRSKKVIELSQECTLNFNRSFEGGIMKVLFEQPFKDRKGFIEGLTDNYIRVVCEGDKELCGCIKEVSLDRADGDIVWGKMVK